MTLSLVRPSLGQWQLFGQLSNNSDNDGLSSLIVNVQATGGNVGVTSSACMLPYGTHYWLDGGVQSQQVGFTQFRSDGVSGIGIRGGQKTIFPDPSAAQVVLTDVGYSAGSYPGDQTGLVLGPTVITWSAPVLIGSGSYSGLYGTLTATVGTGQVNVLDEGRDPSQSGGVHQIEAVQAGQLRVLCPGDTNGDDSVDTTDLMFVTGNWFAPSGKTWANGDFNFDGAVDTSDLALMTAHWFWVAPGPAPAPLAIPEPAGALVLLLGGAAGLLRAGRRWRRR